MSKSISVFKYRNFIVYLSDARRVGDRGCNAGSRLLLLGVLLHVLHIALAASLIAHFVRI